MDALPYEDRLYQHDDLIKFPPLSLSPYSLTPLEKLLVGNFLVMCRPRVVVELGVFRGRTTEYICQVLEENNIDAHVYGFDVPAQVDELRIGSPRLKELEDSGRLTLVPGFLPDSLAAWLETHNRAIDFALVDALHEYPSVNSELSLIWPRLAPHGAVMCHDYDRNPEFEGVRYAVDSFAARVPDAQACSLFMPPDDRIEDWVESYQMASTLALLRRRPYKRSTTRLAAHLNHDLRWKYERNKPTYETRLRALLQKTPLYGLARRTKRLLGK